MTDNISYGGKPLSLYSLWELGDFLKRIEAAEAKREAASKHKKFDKANNKQAMEFPPANPEYFKIKNAIIEEIRKKQNV
jgi:hypothetical protein